MARSIPEIYDEIVSEKETLIQLTALQPSIDNSQTLLTDLTTASRVAYWRLMCFAIAVSIWIHEVNFDRYAESIEARSLELITGTARWYRDQCLIFQYGDDLVDVNGVYKYAAIDEVKKIIKRAAILESGGQVRIKVAKLDASGAPIPLTSVEFIAFSAYVNQFKFAGTNVSIISDEADLLKVSYDVYFDPLVLTPSGELISDPGVYPVEDAINGYIQNLPFNGNLSLTEMTDAAQLAVGVVNPVLLSAAAKYGALNYANIDVYYLANTGHLAIDPAFPLSSQINYIASVYN